MPSSVRTTPPLLTIDMMRLGGVIASALGIRARPEAVRDLTGVYRVGSVMPEPGLRYPVFLAVRSTARCYAETLGALVARQAGRSFAVLVPTVRFLSEDLEHRLRSGGALVIALCDVLDLKNGGMVARADPQRLFSGLGGASIPTAGALPAIVARAIIQKRGQSPRWLDLDHAAYRELLAAADQYDILADERQRRVRKGPKLATDVPVSRFRTIRAALTARGYFDPAVTGPDLDSAKQIFQRARQTFDIGSGRSSWKVLKTVRTDEGHAAYVFQPDPDVSFAFIFRPEE